MNYLEMYTKVRTGEASFHEFMAMVNQVYELAYLNGKRDGLKDATAYLEQVKGCPDA